MGIMLGLFAAVLALVVLNVPIAVALGIVALVAMLTSHGVGILPNLALVTYNGATNFPLLAIPLFILAGAIMNASGISRRLIALVSTSDFRRSASCCANSLRARSCASAACA